MNDDILKGKWNQIKGEVKAKWGRLTNDDLDEINGETQKLVGRLQELYGESKDEIRHSIDHFLHSHSGNGHECCGSTKSETARS